MKKKYDLKISYPLNFAERLVSWFETNKRALPWRETKDPYKIWLSEIILQQTKVSQGLPYYLSFVEKYPTVSSLAAASEEEVLRMWQGLGYYSRARNMHFAAKYIRDECEGKFPTTYEEIIKLKGVGSYTAAAISSIAFNEKKPVVDGNVLRVFSRIFGVEENVATNTGKNIIYEITNALISEEKPGAYNEAVMEMGATCCTPKQPNCFNCIFSEECFTRKNGWQERLPVNKKEVKKKTLYLNYLVFNESDSVYVKKTSLGNIWKGLFDFFVLERDFIYSKKEEVVSELEHLGIEILENQISGGEKVYRHLLSHREINAKFFVVDLDRSKIFKKFAKENSLSLITISKLQDIPKPILIHNYIDEYF